MTTIEITPTQARRLAVTKQRLAGPRPDPTPDGIVELVRYLGCLQIDPIRAVERTQYLVLWSRLGQFDSEHLQTALWKEKRLFEYWAHAASIVLTENFDIHRSQMAAAHTGESKWDVHVREWLGEHLELREQVLTSLAKNPPMTSDQLRDHTPAAGPRGPATAWSTGDDVRWMLSYLWAGGKVVVARREGLRRYWTLIDRWLHEWMDREPIPKAEAVSRAAQISLKALGVGTQTHIRNHFVRGHYDGVEETMRDLVEEGLVVRAKIEDDAEPWRGDWYVHRDDVPLLENLDHDWSPRTVLLSPFDNLICDRARTLAMWGFDFTIEIYVPKSRRKYGYYVMPILHGDRLVGRLDPKMDRKTGTLVVNAVYAEEDAKSDPEIGEATARTVEDLGQFLGASRVRYGRRKPAAWRGSLRTGGVSGP